MKVGRILAWLAAAAVGVAAQDFVVPNLDFQIEVFEVGAEQADRLRGLLEAPAAPREAPVPQAQEPESLTPLARKLRDIVIPQVEFRQAGIQDVVAFLVTASRDADKDETDPARRGVNIVLNMGAGAVPAQPPPITMNAQSISLREVLKIVTTVAGLKYVAEGNVVMVVPRDYVGAIVRRAYTVPPGFFAAGGTPASVKKSLEDMGIPFPAGSSASYVRATEQLLVVNTAENLAKLEDVLRSLNRGSQAVAQRQATATDKALVAFRGMGVTRRLLSRKVRCRSGVEFVEKGKFGRYDVLAQGVGEFSPAGGGVQLRLQAQVAAGEQGVLAQGDMFLAPNRSGLLVGRPAAQAADKAGGGPAGCVVLVTFTRFGP